MFERTFRREREDDDKHDGDHASALGHERVAEDSAHAIESLISSSTDNPTELPPGADSEHDKPDEAAVNDEFPGL